MVWILTGLAGPWDEHVRAWQVTVQFPLTVSKILRKKKQKPDVHTLAQVFTETGTVNNSSFSSSVPRLTECQRSSLDKAFAAMSSLNYCYNRKKQKNTKPICLFSTI